MSIMKAFCYAIKRFIIVLKVVSDVLESLVVMSKTVINVIKNSVIFQSCLCILHNVYTPVELTY